jgi:hypothetical protein
MSAFPSSLWGEFTPLVCELMITKEHEPVPKVDFNSASVSSALLQTIPKVVPQI